MVCLRRYRWSIGLAVGLVVGLLIGGLWPDSPLHATATDRAQNFALATGYVDDECEAVCFLDFLTGALRVAVVSNQTTGFQARYETNINADLTGVIGYLNSGTREPGARRPRNASMGTEIQLPQTPNYLLVTGVADLRRGSGGRQRPGRSLIYVAETNTGVVLAYAVPWSAEDHSANRASGGKLILWAYDQFSTAVKRPQP